MSTDALIEPVIGLIGGSGLYDIDGLEEREWRRVATPWGEPEAAFAVGLGCEERWAPQLVYAQGARDTRPTGIGVNCRLCERPHCPSRAAPALLGGLELSEGTRGLSPFGR